MDKLPFFAFNAVQGINDGGTIRCKGHHAKCEHQRYELVKTTGVPTSAMEKQVHAYDGAYPG